MARKKKKQEAAGFVAGQPRARLTPVDVQEKVFRLSFRGYNEQDVDQFLDQVTEDLAALHEENKRLREALESGGGIVAGDAVRQAEQRAAEIVQQAREQAARIGAAAPGPAGVAAAAPGSFLIRERDFLQKMAGLIQQHAEALKSEARRGAAASSRPAEPRHAAGSAVGPESGGTGRHEASPAQAAAEPPPAAGPSHLAAAAAGAAAAAPPHAPEEATQAHDPLLDEWDEAAPEGRAYSGTDDFFGDDEASGKKEGDEEPSLKELFWGEGE